MACKNKAKTATDLQWDRVLHAVQASRGRGAPGRWKKKIISEKAADFTVSSNITEVFKAATCGFPPQTLRVPLKVFNEFRCMRVLRP